MNESSNEPTLRRLNLFGHARYETFLQEEWHGREAEWIGITRLLYVVVSYLDNLTPSRVLDLSTGSGLTTVDLARLSGEVDGPGWHLVTGARSKEDQLAVRESVEEAGVSSRVESVDVVDPRDLSCYPDGSFDVVLAPTVFQDLPDADDRHLAISEISRVLRDDGWAVLIAEMCEGWTLDHESDGDPSSDAHGHESSGSRDSCFSIFSDIGKSLNSVGLSFPLGYSTIYIGLAKTINDEVWSQLRESGEQAFDKYLIDLEDREYEQEPEDDPVELIVVSRKWNLERDRAIPRPVAEQTGRSKLRKLPAKLMLNFEDVAKGWHVANASVGPDGDLILLLLETTWDDRPDAESRPQSRVRIAHVSDGGTSIVELPNSDISIFMQPFIQPLGSDQWLAVYSNPINDQNHSACIYSAGGVLTHSFHAGTGAFQVQATTSGQIWVAYSHAGTYEGEKNPVFKSFSGQGDPLLGPQDVFGSTLTPRFYKQLVSVPVSYQCNTLNVGMDNHVWMYMDPGGPLIRINAEVVDRVYPAIPVRHSRAFAVHDERALFAGQYRDSETLYYVSFRSMAVHPFIPVDESDSPITFNKFSSIGRGSRLYLNTNESLYMIDLADFRP